MGQLYLDNKYKSNTLPIQVDTTDGQLNDIVFQQKAQAQTPAGLGSVNVDVPVGDFVKSAGKDAPQQVNVAAALQGQYGNVSASGNLLDPTTANIAANLHNPYAGISANVNPTNLDSANVSAYLQGKYGGLNASMQPSDTNSLVLGANGNYGRTSGKVQYTPAQRKLDAEAAYKIKRALELKANIAASEGQVQQIGAGLQYGNLALNSSYQPEGKKYEANLQYKF